MILHGSCNCGFGVNAYFQFSSVVWVKEPCASGSDHPYPGLLTAECNSVGARSDNHRQNHKRQQWEGTHLIRMLLCFSVTKWKKGVHAHLANVEPDWAVTSNTALIAKFFSGDRMCSCVGEILKNIKPPTNFVSYYAVRHHQLCCMGCSPSPWWPWSGGCQGSTEFVPSAWVWGRPKRWLLPWCWPCPGTCSCRKELKRRSTFLVQDNFQRE